MTYEDMARIAARHRTLMAERFLEAYAAWLVAGGKAGKDAQ